MIKNYFKVALRAIVRNKLSAFINIFGLALAIGCSLLIFLFITDELSYDKYNTKADRIYRVTRDFLSPDGSVSLHLGHVAPPFGPLLKNDFPQFEEVARTLQSRFLMSYQNNGTEIKSFNEDQAFYAEPELLDVFTIDVVKGNNDKVLKDPFTLMLSETTAKKYFGDDEPVGKTLRIGNRYDFTVTGIFKDLPDQSHWHPAVLAAFSTLNDSTIYGTRGLESNYGNNSFGTYVLVKEPFDAMHAESLFPAFLDKHMGPLTTQNNGPLPSSFTHLYLQKLTDIHLRSHLDSEVEANGNIKNIYILSVIAIFITLIACFNFINLSTARATKRAKEVGLRKVVGAFKTQLIFQYLTESVLIASLALIVAVGLSYTGLDWLNNFTGKNIDFDIIGNWNIGLGLVVFTLGIGVLAGIYPAFIISGYKPALILKGQHGSVKGKGQIRKFLVVAQFSISIVLIIATFITIRQINFLNDRDLGYNRESVITLRYYNDLNDNYDAFRNELLKHSSIQSIGRSNLIPTGRLLNSQGSAQIQKGDSLENTNVMIKNVNIDDKFFETYKIPVIAGRNFSPAYVNDDSLSFILNEASLRMMGMTADDIMSKDFQYGGVRGKVIGVVKDFHFESLHEEILPVVFQAYPAYSRISIKLSQENIQSGLAQVEKTWKEFIPHRPFEYNFLTSQYQQLYEAEQKQSQLYMIFASIAILIACLGLFGLTTFNTLQRIKEIGIRKVLGASVGNIVKLLSTEIVILILIANVIACPIAWYFMNQWLESFAYRINIGADLFVIALTVTTLTALLTVGLQTIKAARTNPSRTLRYE